MPPDLTLVLPCFQAADELPSCLEALDAWAGAHPALRTTVVAVDDGSTDGTGAFLATARPRHLTLRVLSHDRNRGKGAALRTGVAAARGDRVAFLDVDLAVGPETLGALLEALDGGADLAIGCRNVPGATMVRPQRWLRRNLGRTYLRLARGLLRLEAPDVTCGFKAFDRCRVAPLMARTRCDRWGLDAELLFLARRAGLRVAPRPVAWRDGEASRVRLRRDVWGAWRELWSTRWRGWTGAYGRAHVPVDEAPREPRHAAAVASPAGSDGPRS